MFLRKPAAPEPISWPIPLEPNRKATKKVDNLKGKKFELLEKFGSTLYVLNVSPDYRGGCRPTLDDATVTLREKLVDHAIASGKLEMSSQNVDVNSDKDHAAFESRFIRNLQTAYDKLGHEQPELKGKEKGPEPPILVVLPDKNKDHVYMAVKRWGDCIRGVRTVCVTAATLRVAQHGLHKARRCACKDPKDDKPEKGCRVWDPKWRNPRMSLIGDIWYVQVLF